MAIEKRFQVFVSSTFKDLVDERQQVIQGLLTLDCFPCGMEFFPASNEEVWEAIKSLIRQCDYYVVIVGGKYGSVDDAGISYTEKEYRFAVEAEVPVLAFLHRNPDQIPHGKSESDAEKARKLGAFRELCRTRMCCDWQSADDLKAKVIASLVQLMKKKPAVGWVRADQVPDESAEKTTNRLRDQVDSLKKELERLRREPPKGTEGLAKGKESIDVHFSFPQPGNEMNVVNRHLSMSWDEIFSAMAPCMIREASEYSMCEACTAPLKLDH